MVKKIISAWLTFILCIGGFTILDSYIIPVGLVERASGATIYVSTTGSGGAYTSIQEAIDAANPGDTVFVYAGKYYENVVIDKTLNLYGEDRDTTIIEGNKGYVVNIEANSVKVTDFTLTNGEMGIKLYSFSDALIMNNNISSNSDGIRTELSSGNNITQNIISTNNRHGIYMLESSDNTIIFNNISSNGVDGIEILFSSINNVISLNDILLNDDNGIDIWSDSNCQVNNNDISLNNNHGIYIHSSSSNIVSENKISSNNGNGIHLSSTLTNNIENNDFFNDGIVLSGGLVSSYNCHNIPSSNTVNGKPIYYYKDTTGININGLSVGQLIIVNCSDFNVQNLQIDNTDIGISLAYSSYINILNNNISNNGYGIYMWNVYGNLITGNTLSLNDYDGIILYYSSNNDMSNNFISSNNEYGIHIAFTSGSDIFSNDFVNDGIILRGSGLTDFNSHSIPLNNTVNGKPLYFYKDSDNINIDGISVGQLILVNCDNVSIRNLQISNADVGIEAAHTTNLTITNSNLSSNYCGIYIYTVSNSNFTNNQIHWNTYNGIQVKYSSLNNISNNNISNGKYGIYITSNSINNSIYNNTIASNDYGIYIYSSSFNILTLNTVSDNQYGFYLQGSSSLKNNYMYNNNIMNNDNQAYESSNYNYWNDTYPWGGNFWFDYDGIDINNGPNQDIPGSDGMGDTPYIIDSDSRDYFPLMEPIPDVLPPRINLISPLNNSIIQPGEILDFDIYDGNLDVVNYSIDADPYDSLVTPFDISTTGWLDGKHILSIRASDIYNNIAEKSFNFTVDSKMPEISLNSPENNSLILPGTTIDVSIIDSHLSHVNYSVNQEATISISEPFDISTYDWEDGDYTIQIIATDTAGNTNSTWYSFVIDTTNPAIHLNAPTNNSIITQGKILDFHIDDNNLAQVNYSINQGVVIEFTHPFNISTTEWSDGEYEIEINAMDIIGNINSSIFLFTIDSTKPVIQLNSPNNNSVIPSGVFLNISVTDKYLFEVNHSINGGEDISFSGSDEISTAGWSEGDYLIQINAIDLASNSNISWFFFTIDSSLPTIWFNSSLNHSIMPVGRTIQFNITDPHLYSVIYSFDGEEYRVFLTPYLLNTSNWPDGLYTVIIKANDTAGNEAVRWFEITIDSTIDTVPPEVIITDPINGSIGIDIDTKIAITFSEPMNQMNVETYVSLFPYAKFTAYWDITHPILFISFKANNLAETTTYTFTIDSQITDLNGNPMGSDLILIFTTKSPPLLDSDDDDIPDIDDPDDDNDGHLDGNDTFPLNPAEWMDTDNDTIGNNADADDDNDGYLDTNDTFPLNPNEWEDFDSDGIGDNADPDDDGDGVYDDEDAFPLNPDLWEEDTETAPRDSTWLWLLILVIIITAITVLFIVLRGRVQGLQESSDDEMLIPEETTNDEAEITESSWARPPPPPQR